MKNRIDHLEKHLHENMVKDAWNVDLEYSADKIVSSYIIVEMEPQLCVIFILHTSLLLYLQTKTENLSFEQSENIKAITQTLDLDMVKRTYQL